MSRKKKTESDQPLEEKYYMHVMIVGVIVAVIVACLPLMGTIGMVDPKTAGAGGLWINFLGNFHPLLLHLPIGALMLVFVMEGVSLVTKGKYKSRTTLALAFAAATAVLAVVLGYFWYLAGKGSGETMEAHKRDGVIFTVLMIVTFLVKYSADIKQWNLGKLGYFPLLILSGITMMSTGHHGGKMSHGDPLKKLPSTVLAERKEKQNVAIVTDPVIYTNIVHPILENKCISCHGADKQKGDLRMDSLASMLKGGADEECLVPGKPKDSFLLTSLDLPMDDDYHMPPESKPQITPDEKKILTWWIAMGAPEKTKLSEVKVPTEITAAIATLTTPEERERRRKLKEEEEKKHLAEMKAKREKILTTWEKVNAKFPGSLRYKSQKDTELTFSTVSYRKSFTEADLSILKDVAADVSELDLSSTNISDAAMGELKAFSNLKDLKLNETKVSDAALKVIASLPSLQKLNLYGTNVSDEGIKLIMEHPSLEKVYLWNTKVTPAGAKALQDALAKNAKSTPKEKGKSVRSPEVLLGIPLKK